MSAEELYEIFAKYDIIATSSIFTLQTRMHFEIAKIAKKVSKDLVEWINKGYKVVTLTASCGLMLKFEWPLLLPKNENIKKLSKNIIV